MKDIIGARAGLLLSALVGCVPMQRALDPADLQGQGRTIGVVPSAPPPFIASEGPLNVLTVGVETEARKKFVRDNHLTDPAPWIGERLAGALVSKHYLLPRTPRNLAPRGQPPKWSTDLVLLVSTKRWLVGPLHGEWEQYGVELATQVQLVQTRDRRVLAAGRCERVLPEPPGQGPTYQQMLADSAALVKKGLREAAAVCAWAFARELFGVRLPDDRLPEPVPPGDPEVIYASCHLEGTPAWKAADATEKLRLLHECQDRRRVLPKSDAAEGPRDDPPPPTAAPASQ